jgi:hypothetical protein
MDAKSSAPAKARTKAPIMTGFSRYLSRSRPEGMDMTP